MSDEIDQMVDYLESINYGEAMSAEDADLNRLIIEIQSELIEYLGDHMSTDQQDLSRLIVEIQSAGQEWIKSKLKSDQLVDGEKNYLAALMNNLEMTADGRKMSEGKLERLA